MKYGEFTGDGTTKFNKIGFKPRIIIIFTLGNSVDSGGSQAYYNSEINTSKYLADNLVDIGSNNRIMSVEDNGFMLGTSSNLSNRKVYWIASK